MKSFYIEPIVEVVEFAVEDVLSGASEPITPPGENELPEF